MGGVREKDNNGLEPFGMRRHVLVPGTKVEKLELGLTFLISNMVLTKYNINV